MKTIALAEGVSATAVANQTALSGANFTKTPFLAGRECIAAIDTAGVTGTPNARIQGSEDGTTYVDLLVNTTLGRKEATVKIYPFMRFGVFTAGGAGVYSAHLNADN